MKEIMILVGDNIITEMDKMEKLADSVHAWGTRHPYDKQSHINAAEILRKALNFLAVKLDVDIWELSKGEPL